MSNFYDLETDLEVEDVISSEEDAYEEEYEEAVSWIVHAGLMNRIYNVQKIEKPLRAYSELSQFKLFLHDTGLLCRLAGINPADIALGNDYPFKGKVAENYVLQQLIGKTEIEPFYFMDDHSREIDFIVQTSNGIVPIEVKAGENVQSISLSNYIKKRNPPLAIRFSEKNCGNSRNILYSLCSAQSLGTGCKCGNPPACSVLSELFDS